MSQVESILANEFKGLVQDAADAFTDKFRCQDRTEVSYSSDDEDSSAPGDDGLNEDSSSGDDT